MRRARAHSEAAPVISAQDVVSSASLPDDFSTSQPVTVPIRATMIFTAVVPLLARRRQRLEDNRRC
jgi:hypothetical protein